jgi:hypothetical protein
LNYSPAGAALEAAPLMCGAYKQKIEDCKYLFRKKSTVTFGWFLVPSGRSNIPLPKRIWRFRRALVSSRQRKIE